MIKYWTSINFPQNGTLNNITDFSVMAILFLILNLQCIHTITYNAFNIDIKLIYYLIGIMLLNYNKKNNTFHNLLNFMIGCALIISCYFIYINEYRVLIFICANKCLSYSYYKNNTMYMFISLYIMCLMCNLNYAKILFLLNINAWYILINEYIEYKYYNYNNKILYKKYGTEYGTKNLINFMYKQLTYISPLNSLRYGETHYLVEKNYNTIKIIEKVGKTKFNLLLIINMVLVLFFTIIYKIINKYLFYSNVNFKWDKISPYTL